MGFIFPKLLRFDGVLVFLKSLFLGLTPPAGCAVWEQIWEREDLIAFASSYHDSMLGLC